MKTGAFAAAFAVALGLCGCVASMLHWTPLEEAAYNGDVSRVNSLLAQGAAPGEIDQNGGDAAGLAVETHPDVAKIILQKCLSLDHAEQSCPHGLSVAARLGDKGLVTAFLAKGARPVPESLAGAAVSGNLEIANMMADRGADLDAAIGMLQRRIDSFERMNANARGIESNFASAMAPQTERYRQGLAFLMKLKDARAAAVERQAEAPKAADWWAK